MKIIDNRLIADDGMMITDGSIFSDSIFLGCNDSAENYYEITAEEYEEILGKMEEIYE